MTCPPVAWVDDVAIPLASTTPTLLDQLVVDATTMARDAFWCVWSEDQHGEEQDRSSDSVPWTGSSPSTFDTICRNNVVTCSWVHHSTGRHCE